MPWRNKIKTEDKSIIQHNQQDISVSEYMIVPYLSGIISPIIIFLELDHFSNFIM